MATHRDLAASLLINYVGLGARTCIREFANNTGADQPGHLRCLISAFVDRSLRSITCKHVTGEISIS